MKALICLATFFVFLFQVCVYAQPLTGIYTINNTLPSSGANFANFSDAITALNSNGAGAAGVTFNVSAGQTFTEKPPAIIVSGTATGKVIFQRSGNGLNPLISGINGSSTFGLTQADAVIILAGVDYVVFDGIDVEDNSANTTTMTQMEFGYWIINSSPTKGSSFNVIRNCRVRMNRTNIGWATGIRQSVYNAYGIFGVHVGTYDPSSSSGANHNNRYENIHVENSVYGIVLNGNANFPDQNNVITSTGGDTTIIGSSMPGDISVGVTTTIYGGIMAVGQQKFEISKCIVRNIEGAGIGDGTSGILVINSAASGNDTSKIYNNLVYNVKCNNSSYLAGIGLYTNSGGNILAYNNIVYGLQIANASSSTATITIAGIADRSASGCSMFINNTVRIDGDSSLNVSSAAFHKSGNSATLIRNNIFCNSTGNQTGSAKHFAIYRASGGFHSLSSSNLYWADGTNGYLGYYSTTKDSVWRWIAAISGIAPADPIDAGSAFTNPNFISGSNFNFAGSTPAALSGRPLNGLALSTDYFGTSRNAARPSIGAIETSQAMIDSVGPVISVTISNGSVPFVSANIYDNSNTANGIVFLWYRLQGSSGAFIQVAPDVVPGTGFNGNYQWQNFLQSLPTGLYDFYITARDNIGAGNNIGLSPAPTTLFSGFSSTDPPNLSGINPNTTGNVWTVQKTPTLAGGIYPVGPTSTYQNLTSIANLLNNSELLGDVIFELQSNYDGTVGEIFPITFNPLLCLGGNWKVLIRPALGVSLRETSGIPGSGLPLIILNGIDRISFDGRPGGQGSGIGWLIRNKRDVATLSPTIRFVNGAQFDTLNFLQIESGNTTTAAANAGTLQFSTTNTLQGNSFNLVSNCILRDRTDISGIHAYAIESNGTAAVPNDSNRIENNQLVNFSQIGINIRVDGNGAGWRILNNHFYKTQSANTNVTTIINLQSGYGGNHIVGNIIGGSAQNAGGTSWTNSGSTAWKGISCSVGSNDSTYVHGNVIQNVSKTATGTGTFTGIEVLGGLVSVANNTVGHNTVANSISIGNFGVHIGIRILNSSVVNLYNNLIANISSINTNSNTGVRGISTEGTLSSLTPVLIKNNSIRSLTSVAANTSFTSPAVCGIYSSQTNGILQIMNNTIQDLLSTASVATTVHGITINSSSSQGLISSNRIYDLRNASTASGSEIIGINMLDGNSWDVYNNMVSLGFTATNDKVITGISDNFTNGLRVYFNSVRIGGVTSGSSNTQCFRRTDASQIQLKNNIFTNGRTSGAMHYAVNDAGNPGLNANYNVYSTVSAANLCLSGSLSYSLLAWQAFTNQDINSKNVSVNFISNDDLHLSGASLGNNDLAGVIIPGFTTDFDGDIRGIYPYKGADESISTPLATGVTSISAKLEVDDVLVNWIASLDYNVDHYDVEVSSDGQSFTKIGTIPSSINSNSKNYSFRHSNAAKMVDLKERLFYRIRLNRRNGVGTFSATVDVLFNREESSTVIVFPNPVVDQFFVVVNTTEPNEYNYFIYDLEGRLQAKRSGLVNGNLTVSESALCNVSPGIYILDISVGKTREVIRLIKN